MDHSGLKFTVPNYLNNKRKMVDRSPGQTPPRHNKARQIAPNTTSNRFNPLNNIPQLQKRRVKPTPSSRKYILGHPTTNQELPGIVKTNRKKGYTVKYTRYNTSICFNDVIDKLALQTVTTQANAEFYTYIIIESRNKMRTCSKGWQMTSRRRR